jgi:hypothetical protein
MVKTLKKQPFSLDLERLYTDARHDAYELIDFRAQDAEENEGETARALECPENWSAEAGVTLAEEAAFRSAPLETQAIEENTVPSWLWRRTASGKTRIRETSARQIFQRVAGSAAYAGWKLSAFADENEARVFFDEIRYLLAQRFVALEPRLLARLGLDWAYGVAKKPPRAAPSAWRAFEAGSEPKAEATIRNATIDAILGGHDKDAQRKWRHFLSGALKGGTVALRFADITADWAQPAAASAPRAVLDAFSFRREDGGIDIDKLRHAVKLLVILLELGRGTAETDHLAIGIANLAPLLLALALTYDSDAGRATAAAFAAVVTAEAYATSARLAALLGPSPSFTTYRDSTLRALRNHRRAAYGERNDYEKISVLPAPLTVEAGSDLTLIAAARHLWDEALELARQHGLRHGQVTELFASPALAFFLEGATQGGEPLSSLVSLRATEAGTYRREIHPAVPAALARLGYDADGQDAVIAHIVGTGTLANAPGIDHAALRARGFDEAAIARVENYLSCVDDLHLAFTPWIVGEEFCKTALKVPAGKLHGARFDLLQHLGFTAEAVLAANAFCFGHGSAKSAPRLRLEHAGIFARASEMPATASIRMVAALQSFIAGDADLHLVRPAGLTVEECENLALGAWRQGAKSIAIHIDPASAAQKIPAFLASAHGKTRGAFTGGGRLRSALKSRTKASSKLLGMKRGNAKARPEAGKKT